MRPGLRAAFGLSLGAAVSLGLARFSYALMLPPMRADLGWSYFTAGAMNTVNAAGYLAGALMTARWLRHHDARRLLLAGSAIAGVALVAHGAVDFDSALYLLRFVTGVASAATFVTGGLLAARLAGPAAEGAAARTIVATASTPATGDATRPSSAGAAVTAAGTGPTVAVVQPSAAADRIHAGLALGIYYGGTGIGIVASAVLVPRLVAASAHGWQAGWFGLGVAALIATLAMAVATGGVDGAPPPGTARTPFPTRRFLPGLIAYFLFGLGYIGYMTFVVTLLREQQLPGGLITAFYVVLGIGVFGSSWLWARLLQRFRGGEAMSLLDGLLAVATLLPVVTGHPVAVFASGLLFGGVFLSVVASTTALVRHNVEPAAWSAGIAMFTIVFAAGQIVGPALIGWVADATGGLRGGFALSAGALAVAALVALRQRPVAGGH